MKLAVVAHAGKTLGGGLSELRRTLEEAGVSEPLWIEVPKSKRAPRAVKRALEDGAELILAWGGDGMVRRCVNALEDTQVPLAIVPAGTSNLFATNLGIERDIAQAVQVALLGDRRRLDVGRFNGERFAVMAGAGFDAAMIKGADDLKDRLGRAAYVLGGAAKLNSRELRGEDQDRRDALVQGPRELHPGRQRRRPVRRHRGVRRRAARRRPARRRRAHLRGPGAAGARGRRAPPSAAPRSRRSCASPKARKVRVKLDRKVRYELDGGDRKKVKSFKVDVEAGAITVCVPRAAHGENGAR